MTKADRIATAKNAINLFFIPILFTFFLFLVYIFEQGMELSFAKGGIYPRKLEWIWTIITYIFVHASWSHLLNNILSFLLLSSCLFYFYRPVSLRVFIALWFISGIILWVIGRDSRHIGASGLIYAMASFLLLSGLLRQHIPLIAISLVVTLIYGNMVWHIFPWTIDDPISWEGHLAGFFAGLLIAIIYRKDGPQKPVKKWNETEEFEVEYWNETEDREEDYK
jgi:membrane associated rhomboid family serine protease